MDGGKLLYGEYFGGSWKAVKSTGSVNTGAWTHVAVVRNGNTCLFYINGTASGSGTLNASPQKAATNLNIGCVKFSGAEDIRETYNGSIDNLRIWSTARTADEIKNELGEVLPSEGGLEAYYKFEGNANDTSTKGRNGTSASGITYEQSKVMDDTPATIESLAFTESTKATPVITFSGSANGTIFWGIRKAGETAPTAQDLAGITSAFAMSGSAAYNTATQSASIDITPSLDKESEYKLYGTIRNVVGIYSPVFEHSFTYQGLSCLPTGWKSKDIGTVDAKGSAAGADGTFSVKGSGADIWGNSDELHYAYIEVSGSKQITAHLKTLTGSNAWKKVGVMYRTDLENNSQHAMAALTRNNSNGLGAFVRSNKGGSTQWSKANATNHDWVRVMCRDGIVAVYTSANGTDWEKHGTTFKRANTDTPYYLGIAVCSHADGELCTATFDNVSIEEADQNLTIKDIRTKPADCANLPWKTEVPRIIYPDERFTEVYYETWDIASGRVRKGPSGLPASPYLDENCYEDQIWIWDACFMTMFSKYAPTAFPGKQTLFDLYVPIHENKKTSLRIHLRDNPPMFAWVENDYYHFTGDEQHIDSVLIKKKYLQKHYAYFDTIPKGSTNNDISVQGIYRGVVKDNAGEIRGFTPRGRDKGQANTLWIDAISQQAMSALYIARLCEERGQSSEAQEWTTTYNKLKARINKYYWDEKDGYYYDIAVSDNTPCRIKTPASFWAMLAEVPSSEQARRMANYLTDEKYMGGKFPWNTLSRDDKDYNKETGDYWKGGIWLPTAYMGTKALEKYGMYDLADSLALKLVTQQVETYYSEYPHTIWECYSPVANAPSTEWGNRVRQDFCGWSALGPISLMIENVLGFRNVNAVSNTIDWWLRARNGKHGIENLSLKNDSTNLLFTPQDSTINVRSSKDYTLNLHLENGKQYALPIKAGDNTFALSSVITSVSSATSASSEIIYSKEQNRLRVKTEKGTTMKCYNMNGNTVFSSSKNNISIPTEAWSKGIYILQFRNKNHSYSQKVYIF